MRAHDLSAWQHEHVFDEGNVAGERRTWIVVAITAAMMVAEIVVGWLTNSMALTADGWHMATHAAALAITGISYQLARRHAGDASYAFGTWKIEILGSFASALLLAVVALYMVVESIARLVRPLDIRFEEALWVAVLGLAVNLLCAWLLKGHDHGHDHHDEHEHAHGDDHGHGHGHVDLNMRSAYVHVIADAATSVFAIAALTAGMLAGWGWLDPVMGLAGAALILVWAWQLVRDSSRVLLDREMDGPLTQWVRGAIEADGDAKIADLHLWRVGRSRYACIVSLVADRPGSPDLYRRRLSQNPALAHISIEVNNCPHGRCE